ncbi:MAG: ring-cleaving dioxygenase [Thermoflexus sp.]|uniref:ring-cleaving dioxygenase n=1 Tax=Thermoflexus sp. TaxID=1969742 RepID=UPI0025EA7764|nr:ring-cleaving dioxygenase [Thermoflexus sp.]MCS6965080.1 ring-cleaving dioxygenase [Thermoflexus sp.]MDW8185325.1 ring-cleaving dioxygenase [Anaerolineae bacterium]
MGDAPEILGLHHVTAMGGAPHRNVRFYREVLGLRLVKRTVNFDDPGTYHLYYGDALGRPGTLLTFFPWPGARPGRVGVGQVAVTAFTIPEAAIGYWEKRLRAYGVAMERAASRLEEEEVVLRFQDPDGLWLELAAHPQAETRPGWPEGPVPLEYGIRGLHTVTMREAVAEPTLRFLIEGMGFRLVQEEGDRIRLAVGPGGPGAWVDLQVDPRAPRGHIAVGTVHHVAWRVRNDAEQGAWRTRLQALGLYVTPVMDRKYFHSIYFREPGGVLFEIATDPPGFTVDEAPERLGTGLMLPDWLEPMRGEIERALPPLEGKVIRE